MSVLRKGIRGTAEIAVTLGLVGLLLCVHQLWWTNFEAQAQARSEISDLREDWGKEPAAAPAPDGEPVPDPASTEEPPYIAGNEEPTDVGLDGEKDGTQVKGAPTIRGKAFALVHIPRLGRNFVKPIVEGTSLKSLAQGVGHYTYAPYTGPGQVGNFGIAGHRNGHGEPFRYLNKLRTDDAVVIETKDAWYTYKIVKGPFITKPSGGDVLAAVPPQLGGGKGQRLITLTTCDPEFTSKNRMIYWGTLVATEGKKAGFEPAALR
jgi:sortase A